jgi:flagellar biosynthesis activator protein FlaF
MSLQAYQKAAVQAEDPRDTEYRLFGQVTRALIAAQNADKFDIKTRAEALDWNRRVWSVMGSDCSFEGNKLPDALRASIISLSIWVGKQTSLAMRNSDEIADLIEINRIIMEGLSSTRTAAGSGSAATSIKS